MKKKRSKGVIFLCLFLVLQGAGGSSGIMVSLYSRNLNLSRSGEEKIKMIQTDQNYKNLNIKTIEEYDDYWKNLTSPMLTPFFYINAILPLFFLVGIFLLLDWSRIGLILLEICRIGQNIYWIDIGFNHQMNNLSTKIIHIGIAGIIIYFLTRPKVKEQFSNK